MNERLLTPLLNKYSIQEEEIRKIGDKILENKLIVKYKYIPQNIDDNDIRLDYSNKEFNWVMEFGSQTNMAMLHLHSLEPISYLLLAYDETNEIEYLEKAYKLFFDWHKHAENSDHFYLWYRHCVADRAVVISQLYLLRNHIELSIEQNDTIYYMIFSHRNFLTQQENYVKHNHGLLMDMGLISLSAVTNDKATFEFSLNRIKINFSETFTENMICVENSISYSVYNIEQFIKCQKYLIEPLEKTIDEQFDYKIEKALNFLDYIKQPDDNFPHIGDGEQIDLGFLETLEIYKFYKNHHIFKITNKEDYMKVYPNEGYAVFKNKNFYLFLTAGDIKKNHKHADDLSFTLFYNEEIFIDPGIYSYNNDHLRNYQTSSTAHNTIVLNNENYDYINNQKEEVKILSYNELEDYYYLVLQNSSYSYANIIRHLFVLKLDFTIVIIDEVFSRTKVLASQFFNLSPKISENLSLKSDLNVLQVNDKVFIQKEWDSFLEFYNGMNPYETNAVASKKFHELQPIIKFSINKYSENPNITTMLSNSINNRIEKSDVHDEIIFVNTNEKKVKLVKENIDIDRFKDSTQYINIERNSNTIKCETIANLYDKQEYAWDIMKGKEKEKLIWYQESNSFEYTFSNPGTYTIRCYVRNKCNNEEKHSFINKQKIIV